MTRYARSHHALFPSVVEEYEGGQRQAVSDQTLPPERSAPSRFECVLEIGRVLRTVVAIAIWTAIAVEVHIDLKKVE